MSVHSIKPNTCDSKELFQPKNVSTTSSKIVNVTFYLEYIFYTKKKRYTTDCPVPLSDLHHFGGGSDRISKFYYHRGLCIQETLSGTSILGSKIVTQLTVIDNTRGKYSVLLFPSHRLSSQVGNKYFTVFRQ